MKLTCPNCRFTLAVRDRTRLTSGPARGARSRAGTRFSRASTPWSRCRQHPVAPAPRRAPLPEPRRPTTLRGVTRGDGIDGVRTAVVDMGTNSTRLLVADVADGSLTELERRSTVTRLGRGVDTSGQLAAEAIEDVCEAVARVHLDLRAARARPRRRDRDQRRPRRRELGRLHRRAARALRARRPRPRRRRGGAAHLRRRPLRPPRRRADAGDRHRRRLDRADRRHRPRDRLPRLASGRHRAPHRALPAGRPAGRRRARGGRRRRPLADRGRARGRRAAERRGGDRRRRHPDLAGRDRPGARPLRPRGGRWLPALARGDPADVLAALGDDARGAPAGHRACTRAGRRRSSPAS